MGGLWDFIRGPATTKKGRQGLKNGLLGSPDKLKKLPTGTKEQQKLHNQQLMDLMGMGREGYNEAQQYNRDLLQQGNEGIDNFEDFINPYQNKEAFQNFSEPYMKQFEEQVLPRIAEKFAGMGGLSSSGFAQSLSGGASGLQSQLAKLFSDLVGNYQTGRRNDQQFRQTSQQNSANNLSNAYQNATNTALNYEPFAYNQKKGSQGFLGPLLGAVGTAVAGPLGGQLALQAGNTFANQYNGR